jgi:hypothetical protein
MRIFVHNRRLWPGFSSWKASRTRRKPLNDLGWYIYITFSFSFNADEGKGRSQADECKEGLT